MYQVFSSYQLLFILTLSTLIYLSPLLTPPSILDPLSHADLLQPLNKPVAVQLGGRGASSISKF